MNQHCPPQEIRYHAKSYAKLLILYILCTQHVEIHVNKLKQLILNKHAYRWTISNYIYIYIFILIIKLIHNTIGLRITKKLNMQSIKINLRSNRIKFI